MLPIIMSILSFWKGLPGPVRKVVEYIALLALAFWAFKVFWLNPHDNRVEAESRIKVSEDLKKDFDTRYKQQIKTLQEQNATLEGKAARLQVENADLARSRETIVGNLNKSLANIKLIGATQHAQDQSVPDYMLDGRLRDVSNDLECAKPGSTKIGCPGAVNGTGKTATP
jgi:hypothetical protein